MGEGALRVFGASLIVADRRGLLLKGAFLGVVGLTAELGGGFGGDTDLGFGWR